MVNWTASFFENRVKTFTSYYEKHDNITDMDLFIKQY